MNLQVQISTELEAALNTIAAREQRDLQDVIRGALERFALDNSKPLPFGLALPKALEDLSVRVDELLFQDGLRP
jgi:hypothetical protein